MHELDWYRGPICDPEWASHLEGALENLRTSIHTTKMTLTVETRFYDTGPPHPPSTSSPSTLSELPTPGSSVEQQSTTDAVVDGDAFYSMDPAEVPFDLMSPHFPGSVDANPESGILGKMTSQVSAPGSNEWTSWSEQTTSFDMWRL